MPRQMPSTGRPRVTAARASASSKRSSSGSVGPSSGCGSDAVRGRVQVGPARQDDGVEAPEQRVDRLGRDRRQDHGHPAGRAHGLEVALAERQLRARRLALRDELAVARGAHLGGRDADEWRRAHHSTHVSFPPPRCELFTTSAPRSSATLVRPPGATAAPSGVTNTNGRRSTWRGSSRPSMTVG